MMESQFVLPESQAGFGNFRSYVDNLTILTNHIHLAFMNKASLLTVFFTHNKCAFDNVVSSILVQDLRTLGFLANV